jgi:hypothetical protein
VTGEERDLRTFLISTEIVNGRNRFGDIGIDRRILLKWLLRKMILRVWSGL